MKCKECLKKQGYEFKSVGAHTVIKIKCESCNKVKTIWPIRHFRKRRQVNETN